MSQLKIISAIFMTWTNLQTIRKVSIDDYWLLFWYHQTFHNDKCGVIRSGKSKDRQYNGQRKKTNNDLQKHFTEIVKLRNTNSIKQQCVNQDGPVG